MLAAVCVHPEFKKNCCRHEQDNLPQRSNTNINAAVKNTALATFKEAYNNALQIECNRKGPVDHTISLENGPKWATVNAVNAAWRGGTRGRGACNGVSRPNYTASNSVSNSASRASNSRNLECWYCRKPGHVQQHCRK
jgi:hypothetical protein